MTGLKYMKPVKLKYFIKYLMCQYFQARSAKLLKVQEQHLRIYNKLNVEKLFSRIQGPTPAENRSNVVYQIDCSVCD